MIGYLSVGHLWVNGPRSETAARFGRPARRRLHGFDNGKFRFAKIYNGENWNPQLHAPLTQPGVNVHVGDYLLAVNGKPVTADREVYAGFQETAGKQTTITVGPNANGTGARDVVVVPLASERGLRYLAWIEDNRRMVDRLSGGKLGYVHLPDTEYGGFTSFNRYFFAQVGKQGIVFDERYNHGGQIADYVIDVLEPQSDRRDQGARRPNVHRSAAGHLRPQSHGNQSVRGLGRRRAAVASSAKPTSARSSACAPGAAWSASAGIRC